MKPLPLVQSALIGIALFAAACQPQTLPTPALSPSTPTVFGPGLGYEITLSPANQPSATPGPQADNNGLVRYENAELGLQLVYPASYLQPENASCAPQTRIDEDGGGLIQIGRRTTLSIQPAEPELTLSEAEARLRKAFEIREFEITATSPVQKTGAQGLQIDYRFGGTNRFGRAILLLKNGREYIFTLTSGDQCPGESAILESVTLPAPVP